MIYRLADVDRVNMYFFEKKNQNTIARVRGEEQKEVRL